MERVDITGSCEGFPGGYAARFFALVCSADVSVERVLRQLYPDGATCASCRVPITGRRALQTFFRGERTHCAACNSKFSPRAGTILAESKLTYSQFEIICLLLSLGTDQKLIAHLAGVHEDTVAAWNSKIRFWESHV